MTVPDGAAIEIADLRKVYGRTVAIDGLSLEVSRGEVFGFLGPNGAGKTTTVKILMGLTRHTDGEVRVLGRPPGDPEVMRRVGFLPEHFRFQQWMTARALLDLHGRLTGMTRDQRAQRAAEVLERLGLAEWADAAVGTFSKGMSQRLGLAQALLAEPSLVFLDEPTSALDPLGRREVRDIIGELRRKGVTVFVNSHLLSEVELTCDRIAIVKEGRVVRAGSLADLVGDETDVTIRADGMTPALVAGLGRWGTVRDRADAQLTLVVATEEVLPEVAGYLVAGGARLRALAPRRPTLEELFVRTVDQS